MASVPTSENIDAEEYGGGGGLGGGDGVGTDNAASRRSVNTSWCMHPCTNYDYAYPELRRK
jgi:hypothetical protein